jgi:drug/metabolite transporter (DMT)-like permease
VSIVFALLSAAAYGTSDFCAGLASRRVSSELVTFAAQALGVLTAAVAILLFPGNGPAGSALAWGAVSGIGSALGVLSLYHGLAVARMTVVVTLCAVLTTVIPVIVGVALGNQLGIVAIIGIVIAVPAIALVSWQPGATDARAARAGPLYGVGARRGLGRRLIAPVPTRPGPLYGVLAGLGFALLFIALDQAGTHAGAWPLLPGQLISLLIITPFAYRALSPARRASSTTESGRPSRTTMILTLAAGVLSGAANLLFLAATSGGQLAVVAVLTSLYPAATVVLARVVLAERWTRSQVVGLLTALTAVILVSTG